MECQHHSIGRRGSKEDTQPQQTQLGIGKRTFNTPNMAHKHCIVFMFTLLSLWMCSTLTTACNIDTTRPVIFKAPDPGSTFGDYSDGLFGYSVLQHKTAEAVNNLYILIGAPTAYSYYLDFNQQTIEKPGVLFQCHAPPDTTSGTCFEKNLDESGNTNPVGPELEHLKENAWIGVSLTRQPSKKDENNEDLLSDITVCGHRYANNFFVKDSVTTVNTTFDPNDRFPNGICYTFGHDQYGAIETGKADNVRASIPCAEVNQTDGVNTRVHGWCQAGMSAQYSSDRNSIMLGAVGSYNWTGTVFQGDSLDLNFKPAADTWGQDYDYIGYAITSGRFLTRDTVQGVTSAPRALRRQNEITEGKVIIYDMETQEVYQELYGEMMSTYYGSAIKAIDLNNDGWSDLLVGAPLYAVDQDEGRVYVYINNGRGKVEPLDFKLSGSNAFGARFGSAIAGAGDLNVDTYQDVVIGAPWEDDNVGAIYVYFGTKNGIQRTYSQRISGLELAGLPNIPVGGLKSFGISLDGGLDMDRNILPDIVVGAAASEVAILFKTRPVANMRVWLQMSPDPLDPESSQCELQGKPITCVTVEVCFFYEAVSTPTTLDMDIELTVDYYRLESSLSARFYFMEDDTPSESFYRKVTARYGEEVCFPYKAYLEKKARDFLTPLSFHLYYGIHQYPYEPPRGDNPEKYVGGLPPIIDENICGNGTLIDELRFISDCGADQICQTDLQLKGEVIFPGGESTFTVGAYSTMHTEFQVNNVGEEAHNAQLVIMHSQEIVFEALEESRYGCLTADVGSAVDTLCSSDVKVTCLPVPSQNNTAAVECSLGNPMKPMTTISLRLRFDVGAVTFQHSKGVMDVSAEARTISIELDSSNDNFNPNIAVNVIADTAVRGRSEPATVYYETNTTAVAMDNPDIALMEALVAAGIVPEKMVEKMRADFEVIEVLLNNTEEERIIDEQAIGPPFSLLFEATNAGPGRMPFDSVLYVSIPWRLSNGDWLVYFTDIKIRGVAGTCNGKEALQLQAFRLEEHYVNKTTSPNRDMEKGYTKSNGVEVSKNSKQLACTNAKCVTIKCNIDGPLHSGESFVIEVDALLWVPTFVQSELSFKELVSSSAIVVDDPNDDQRQPEDHEPDSINLVTGVFTDQPPKQPIAWWIIFLSVLGGILLLLLIILILYKVGFFKRQTKDEMEKIQQAASI